MSSGKSKEHGSILATILDMLRQVFDPSISWAINELSRVLDNNIRLANVYFATSLEKYFLRGIIERTEYRFKAYSRWDGQKKPVVGLSSGVWFSVNDACSTVVHHPKFLPGLIEHRDSDTSCQCLDCGGSRCFCGWLHDYRWLELPRDVHRPAWVPMVASKVDTPASVLGDFLMNRCLHWLCMHEVGHIALQHHKLAHRMRGDLDPETEFAMELEADAVAVSLFCNLKGACEDLNTRIERAKRRTSYSGEWPDVTRDFVKRVLYVVPAISTFIIQKQPCASKENYPNPAVRYLTIVNSMREALASQKISGFDLLTTFEDVVLVAHSLDAGTSSADEFIRQIFMKGLKTEAQNRYVAFVRDHGTLEQRLDRYKLFPRADRGSRFSPSKIHEKLVALWMGIDHI